MTENVKEFIDIMVGFAQITKNGADKNDERTMAYTKELMATIEKLSPEDQEYIEMVPDAVNSALLASIEIVAKSGRDHDCDTCGKMGKCPNEKQRRAIKEAIHG